jgi:hypothetical protein
LNIVLGDIMSFVGVPTDGQGYFNVTFPISENQTLGPTVISYVLQGYFVNTRQGATIAARTFLTCDVSQKLNLGDTLNATVALKDDHQQPMGNMQIKLDFVFNSHNRTSFESLTDSDGKAEYTGIAPPSDAAENLTYTMSFPGNAFYLPASYSGNVNLSSKPGFYNMLLLIFAAFLPSLTILSAFIWKRRKNSESNLEGSVVLTAPVVLSSKKKVDLHTRFPQISNPFPLVWGVGESLMIELDLNGYDKSPSSTGVSLRIDEETETPLKASGSTFQAVHVFDAKGSYRLRAKFSGDDEWEESVAEVEIRIVDYREEIVDVFNSFFKSAKTKFQGVNDDMTPRELQAALVNHIHASKYEPLETAISIFEVADYSLHEVARKDYERIYLALKDVEG